MSLHAIQKPKSQIWYLAPTYSQSKEQFDRISSHPEMQKFIKRTNQHPYPKIQFKNGSVISFRSWERPKNLRGAGLDLLFLDEIQSFGMMDQIYPVLRPLISDKKGKLVLAGQHRGMQSLWYKDFFLPGLDPNQPLYRSWSIPSSRGMCFQTEAGKQELELVKRQIPRVVFEQEYLCVPTANQSSVFRMEDIAKITKGIYSNNALQGISYAIGLDLGRVVDPSAHVVIDENGHVPYSELRPLKEPHEIGAQKARDIVSRFNNCTLVVDTTGTGSGSAQNKGDAFVEHYKKVIPTMTSFTLNTNSKTAVIQNLSLAIEQGQISIAAENKELLKQLETYEYKLKPSGIIEYAGPSGHDDDLVIALALALVAYNKGWIGGSTGGSKASDLLNFG